MLHTFTMNRSGGEPVACGNGFAMLHAGARQTAVLICGPWGYEALCAYKSLRLLADRLSASGFATLRFDYSASGDSAQVADELTGIEDWISSVQVAAQSLLKHSGASRIVVLGMGLGALLAQHAASRIEELAGVVLLAPPSSGKRYLRELSAWSTIIDQSIGLKKSSADRNDVSIAGFQLPAAIVRTLPSLTSENAPETKVPHLVVGQQTSSSNEDLANHLTGLGVPTTKLEFTGYDELMSDPTAARTPETVWRGIVSWLETSFPEWDLSAASERPADLSVSGTGFVETPLRFGANRALFGVLCTPSTVKSTGTPAYILVNSGYDPHIGWARSSVEQARFLAANGIASLRFDCADIGDSPALPSSPFIVLYSQAQQDDVKAAVDVMVSHGFQSIFLAGRCAGAFAALDAAVADERVAGAVLINLQRLVWDPDEKVEEAIRNTYRAVSSYGARLLQRETLAKIFRGEIDVIRTGRSILRRMTARVALGLAPYSLGLTKHSRLHTQVRKKFETLSKRNVRLSFVFSSDDGGLDEMAAYFGRNRKRLAGFSNVSTTIIAGADHNMTGTQHRDAVQQHMLGFARFSSPSTGRSRDTLEKVISVSKLERAS